MREIPIIDIDKTGQNIKRLRTQANISVKELSKIYGFRNPTAIYRWEQGKALPTIDNLLVLARVFGVSMDEIIVCKGV